MKSRTPVTIAIILGAAVLVYAVYTYVFAPAQIAPGTLSQSGVVNPAAPDRSQSSFLDIIVGLRSLELDGSIFTNPAFRSLQDFGVTLGTQPKGRPNPFAPLGVDAVVAASVSTQTAPAIPAR